MPATTRTGCGAAARRARASGHVAGRDAGGNPLPQVSWVYFCRSVGPENLERYGWGSVQLIGYNRQSGATCFFEAADGRKSLPEGHPANSEIQDQRPWVSFDGHRMVGQLPGPRRSRLQRRLHAAAPGRHEPGRRAGRRAVRPVPSVGSVHPRPLHGQRPRPRRPQPPRHARDHGQGRALLRGRGIRLGHAHHPHRGQPLPRLPQCPDGDFADLRGRAARGEQLHAAARPGQHGRRLPGARRLLARGAGRTRRAATGSCRRRRAARAG